MKKFVKWFTFWTIVLGALALGICYLTIPEQTKSAIDVVVGYLNTPLGIAGGTTITVGLVVGVIIKVIYDRYQASVRNDIAKVQEYVNSKEQEAEKYFELAKKQKEESIVVLENYSERIDDLLDKLVLVCETMPNAKVKALGEQIKNNGQELKSEIKDKLESLNNDFVGAMEEKIKLEELNDKVNSLMEQLERLVNNNGRKETTND